VGATHGAVSHGGGATHSDASLVWWGRCVAMVDGYGCVAGGDGMMKRPDIFRWGWDDEASRHLQVGMGLPLAPKAGAGLAW